jgi:hypothetical protein
MTIKSGILFVSTVIIFLSGCRGTQDTQAITAPTASPAASGVPAPSVPTTTKASSDGVKAKTDACALLTKADIEAVQKEAVKETKLSGSSQGGFAVSQCFFTLPTFNNSISLQVTQRGDGSASRDPREFWKDTFHPEAKSEKEREKKEGSREEEEEGGAPPQRISGVGDEAFWVGSRISGALYALKGNSYLRLSIGGGGPQSDKIQRLKSLAQKIIERL